MKSNPKSKNLNSQIYLMDQLESVFYSINRIVI